MPSVNLMNMEKDIVTDRLNSSFRNCSETTNVIGDGLSSLRNNSMNFNSFSNSLDAIGSSSNGSINYSAFVSPCQNSKLSFNLSNSSASHLIGSGDFRSLQNSPFYNHYPGNSSNISEVDSPNSNLYSSSQNSTQKTFNSNQVNNIERILKNGGPQRELFTQQSLNSNGLRYQDRLYYYSIAQSQGYIVGLDLERIKENSRRSMSQTYGRISAYFRNRYGETEAKTKASYLQLGVRVPSKDHVSEIVGKGGQKIKLIREETGALITTPGENEEHVFIIEAPPEIALNVANHLTRRAQEITQSKLIAGDRRRGSAGSGTPGANSSQQQVSGQCFTHNLIGCPVCVNSNNNGISQSSMPNSPANNNGISMNSNSNGSLSMLTTRSSSNNLNGVSNGAFNNNGNSNGNHSNSSSPPPSSSVNFIRNTTLTSGNGSSNTITNCINNLPGNNGLMNGNSANNGNNNAITSSRILLARGRISVPQDMVGKIIGTQGSIITTIQKDTGTEIKSPPKEAGRGPDALADFEISAYQGLGLTSSQAAECRVQQAKQLIGHLVMRQLERRTSDDIDEVVLTPGSERGTSATSTNGNSNNNNVNSCSQMPNTPNGNPTNGTFSGHQQNISWMWPDVAQMDSNEAREVLDRILAESKSKTRRVKEVGSVGNNSPNDCFQNPNGSSLNGTEVWIQNAVAAAAASNGNTNGSNTNLPSLSSSQLANSQRYNEMPMLSLSHYQQMAKSSLPSSPLRSNGIDSSMIDPFSNHQLCMQSNNSSNNNSVLNRYYMQSPGAGNANSLLDSDTDLKNSNFSLEQGANNFLDNDFARLWNSMGISQSVMNNNNPVSAASDGSDCCAASGNGSIDENNKPRTTNGNVGAIGDGRRRSTPPSSENNFGRASNSTSTSSSRGESLGDHFNHQMYINSTNNTANSVLSKLFLQSPPASGTGSNVQDFENSPSDYNDNSNCVLIQF